ncbi:MAG: hypothetical protein AAF658_14320, partial [Myxococcota bacterium]
MSVALLSFLLTAPCDWVGEKEYRYSLVPTVGYGAVLDYEASYHTNWSTCVAREQGIESVDVIIEVRDAAGRWVESERRSRRLVVGLEPEKQRLRFRVSDRHCQTAFPERGGYAPSRTAQMTEARVKLLGVKQIEHTSQPLPLQCQVSCPNPYTRPSLRVNGDLVTVSFSPKTDFVDCALRRGGAL